MSAKNILIVANSLDVSNFREVAKSIDELGYNAIVYMPDLIADGTQEFTVRLQKDRMILSYQGKILDLREIYAAWFRSPSDYGNRDDALRWHLLQREYDALQENIWSSITESVWLNSPHSMQRAAVKLLQLKVAASLGFSTPETVMSNSWQSVESLAHERLIVKTLKGIELPSPTGYKVLPTTIVNRDALPKQATPYPGVWQPYVEKKREWRVTVVGEQVFSAAIYTDEFAKDDWRKHQFGPGVTFKAETFPEDLTQKCIALLRHFDLRYGAFDFIEKPDGEIVFLEVNANGQFMWLEQQLGLPISKAIADELVRIADGHTF